MGRIVGIRYRVKMTKEGEARPTEIVIFADSSLTSRPTAYKLDDEMDELDFVFGRFPVSYREAREGDNISGIISRHIKEKKSKNEPAGEEITKKFVPTSYDGLGAGDTVVAILGGSGRKMMFAISRKAEKVGAKVLWVSSGLLNKFREGDKENDAENVVRLFVKQPDLFHEVTVKDRELILLRERLDARVDAMKARIACEQRLMQRIIGNIFCSEEGLYPEGKMEDLD